jgi:DNA-binding MarR family transcriptional regulator
MTLISLQKLVSIANYISMKKSSANRAKTPELKGSDTAPDVLAVADRLHSAAIHLLRRVRKEDTSSGEGPARLSALSVLVFGGPKTLGELAVTEQVKPPTMSRIVAGLERGRLIEIMRDPADARRLRIQASAKGARLLQAARQKRVALLSAGLQKLRREEFVKLQDAVEVLRHLLSEWQ